MRGSRSLVGHVSEAIAVFDASSALRYLCPLLERVTGYKLEELAGRSPLELLHPDDVERAVSVFAGARDDDPEMNPSVEFWVRHADGSWRCLEVACSGFFDDDSIVTVLRDVTGRKRAEEAHVRAGRGSGRPFEDSAVVMALVSLEGRLEESNRALQL